MKKSFFSAVLTVVCLFGLVVNASATSYKGTLSNIKMNGKAFSDATNQKFELLDNGDGTYQLTGTVGPIGKMPGTIEVDVPVTVTNGVITPVSINSKAGKLIITLTGTEIEIKLKSLTGTVTDNTLHFVLDTYAGWKALPLFPASVTFNGSK